MFINVKSHIRAKKFLHHFIISINNQTLSNVFSKCPIENIMIIDSSSIVLFLKPPFKCFFEVVIQDYYDF